MKRIRLFLLVGVSLLSLSFYLNGDLRQQIQQGLAYYIRIQLPEKVYVHTDKPYYTAGETIWFKTYLVEGVMHTPLSKSRVVYVDLIDPQDSILATRTLYIQNGGAAGDFELAPNVPSGTYLLRAYTYHLRNHGDDYFFTKAIPVWYQTATQTGDTTGIWQSPDALLSAMTFKPDIQFLPEGGDLIGGLTTNVGIKAILASGQSISLDGKVMDEQGKLVSFFKTNEFGLGLFRFTPVAAQRYSAVVNFNGVEYAYNLPEVLPQGYVLNIENKGDKLTFRLATNHPTGLEGALLVGHMRGELFCTVEGKAGQSVLLGELSTEDIADGVAHFTLFNSMGKPVSERLVFVDHPDNDVDLQITTNRPIYGTREEVQVQLDLDAALVAEEFANLSMTVTDQAVVQTPERTDNIKSWLLVNSDLKGAIEQPGYYFSQPLDAERRRALDILMLTQGWRRFVWEDLLEEQLSLLSFEPEQGIHVNGMVSKWERPEAPVAANVILSFLGEGLQMEDQLTGEDGQFKFGPYFFTDTASVVLQARIPKKNSQDNEKESLLEGKRTTSIYLTEKSVPEIHRPNVPQVPWSPLVYDFLNFSQRSKIMDVNYDQRLIELSEVTVRAKRQEKEPFSEITRRHGPPTRRLIVADNPALESAPTLQQLLQGLPGVSVIRRQGSLLVLLRGAPASYVIDGLPVSSDLIESFVIPADIALIDMFIHPNEFSGPGIGIMTNVIVIHTRMHTNVPPKALPTAGISSIQIPGFHLAREFYSPNYAQKQPEHVKPDFRTTLHWAPDLRLEQEPVEVSFFTADQSSVYQIEIEGVTTKGRVVRAVQQFEVRKD